MARTAALHTRKSPPLDQAAVWKEFRSVVNMSPSRLDRWLDTEESKDVGWTEAGQGESVGHRSGRRIIALKRKKKAELTAGDYRHMQKVVGFVHRHLAQKGPVHDKAHSHWRYSLMNWGYDPLGH